MGISEGRAFPAEETASAKAPRLDCVWRGGGLGPV